ncbi:MAG: RagB/SusD family nutrient uptake outer membrane protein [Flavobacteriaceae bacterium]|jgi:hypothetical protein
MKKLIFFFALTISMVSCTKEFLNINSETALTTGNYFKSRADMESAVNGIYASLRDIYNNAWMLGEFTSDNTYYALNISRGAVENEEQIANHNWQRANPNIANKFSSNYVLIARANQVIKSFENGAEDNLFEGQFAATKEAEARFLRALSYFDLVQYFGDIPLVLEPAQSFEETRQPAVTPAEVYAQIKTDLEFAKTNLPNKSSQETGRASKEAAHTLLANVHIVLKEWGDAVSELNGVIGSPSMGLESEFSDVFDPSNKNGIESIFEVQYLEGNQGFASNFTYPWLPLPLNASTYGEILGVGNPQEDNNRQAFNLPSPEILAAFDQVNDKRYAASIKWTPIENSANYPVEDGTPPDHPYISKFLHAHANWGQANENWPIYRYAEAKLMIAEALFMLNNSDPAALQHVNDIRSRAGLNPLANLSEDLILQERRLELAFEAKRYLDLKRTGKLSQVMQEMGNKLRANPQAYYYPPNTNPPAGTLTDIKLDFEIPSAEAALNPNID